MTHILHETKGPVTWITLNRPDSHNALLPEMHHKLSDAFDAYARDDSQRVCVITGAGDKAFCAGSDLKAGIGTQYPDSGYGGLAARFDLDKPVIAAVNGFALGGGFELALACDLIIATRNSRFGLPEPLVGAVALGGGIHRLTRQIPMKQAMGMLLSSRQVSAEEGYRMGFVNAVVPATGLITEVEDWCEDIIKGEPLSIRATKAVAQSGLAAADLQSAVSEQGAHPAFQRWLASEDASEGVAAFKEKRKPKWKGT